MSNNKFLRILCSLPVILIALYYTPFLGLVLIIFRFFINVSRKIYNIPATMIILGILIKVPFWISKLGDKIPSIPYLDKIVNNSIYTEALGFSKNLIIYGIVASIILSIISYIKNQIGGLASKANNLATNYIKEQERMTAEEKGKNDLIMKEKREKAANTGVVICPHCGASNMLSSQTGTCQFCRNPITQNK